jgi:nitrite reductase/ring-hydroxylating ferredoxin subunit
MGLFKRILGICATRPPDDPGCWSFANGKIEITLARAAELAKPGGAIRLEGGTLPCRVLVFRGDDGRYHALPNRCSHAAHRRLDLLPGQGKVRCCSIGQSEFDYAGQRLAGSAKESIVPLAVEVDGERLVVSLD